MNIGVENGMMALYYSALLGMFPEVAIKKITGVKVLKLAEIAETTFQLEGFTNAELAYMCGINRTEYQKVKKQAMRPLDTERTQQ